MARFQGHMSSGGPQHPLPTGSSSGSLQGGSTNNGDVHTDDEDSDCRYSASGGASGAAASSYRERRREAHTAAEQKRRDAIKKGYDYLQDLLPTGNSPCSAGGGSGGVDAADDALSTSGAVGTAGSEDASSHEDLPTSNGKVSKATVLQKSIDYILTLKQLKMKQEEELFVLKKELRALEIMSANYERLVEAQQLKRDELAQGGPNSGEAKGVSTEMKFEVFKTWMDALFESFNDKVSMRNFSELSAGLFAWIEEHCKPEVLQELMHLSLIDIKSRYSAHSSQGLTSSSSETVHDQSVSAGARQPSEDRQQHHLGHGHIPPSPVAFR